MVYRPLYSLKPNLLLVLVSCFLIFQSGCARPALSEESAQIYLFEGLITAESVDAVRSELKLGATFKISSPGGEFNAAMELAELLIEKEAEIQIHERCISACAEFILPISKSVRVSAGTVIGFHGNQFIFNKLYELYDPQERLNCFLDASRRVEDFYDRINVNKDFSNDIYSKIRPYSVYFEDDGTNCGLISYRLQNEFWYPSPEQISIFLGYEIKGATCNSSKICLENYVQIYFRKGGKGYAIHDEFFTW